MRVHDRLHVGALFVNAHMHFDLGRRLESLIRLNDLSVFVDFADVFGSHETFAHARGGAKKFVVVEFNGNITVVCSNHAAVVDTLANVANLFFDFELVYHFYLS